MEASSKCNCEGWGRGSRERGSKLGEMERVGDLDGDGAKGLRVMQAALGGGLQTAGGRENGSV